MFVLKQPRPQHLTLIMKNLAQNERAFEQILVKKTNVSFKSRLPLFPLSRLIQNCVNMYVE